MKIELKRIDHNDRLSEESAAFSADLVIEGKKAGIASNKGNGGVTSYYPINEEGSILITKAEEFLKKQPSKTVDVSGEKVSVRQSLDGYIDQLVEDQLNQKVTEKIKASADKAMKQNIIYGLPGRPFTKIPFKVPINMLLLHPNGENVLKGIITGRVLPKMLPGEKILNTNIPETILKAAGLNESLYTKQIESSKEEQKQKPVKQRVIRP